MPKFAKSPIEFAPRSVSAGLRVPIAARLVSRVELRQTEVHASYEAKRIGIEMRVHGRFIVPAQIAARILQSEFDVMTHRGGVISIPRPAPEPARPPRRDRRGGAAMAYLQRQAMQKAEQVAGEVVR